MLRPRRSATRSRSTPAGVVAEMVLTDSIAAQRTRREPCLVIRPRWTWVSDSWCLGVSPAQQVSFGAEANRVMSPISATNTAPRVGPMPGIFWTAVYPGSRAMRPRTMPANRSTSKSRSSISRRSEAIRAAYGAGTVSYTHLRAHETRHDLVCRLLLEKKKKKKRKKEITPKQKKKKKKQNNNRKKQ